MTDFLAISLATDDMKNLKSIIKNTVDWKEQCKTQLTIYIYKTNSFKVYKYDSMEVSLKQIKQRFDESKRKHGDNQEPYDHVSSNI